MYSYIVGLLCMTLEILYAFFLRLTALPTTAKWQQKEARLSAQAGGFLFCCGPSGLLLINITSVTPRKRLSNKLFGKYVLPASAKSSFPHHSRGQMSHWRFCHATLPGLPFFSHEHCYQLSCNHTSLEPRAEQEEINGIIESLNGLSWKGP